MVLIKKIVATYQYIYFRLLIYHIKEWQGIKKIGSFNSNFAITASAIALIYSIELIYRRICETSGFLNDEQSIVLMALSVVIIHSLIFSQNDEKTNSEI
ncbi:MAG: hypothetical protein R3259_02730 [Salinimicrobium sediminis]|nr:hypothetical protein [Salinimicrobium sediminis]